LIPPPKISADHSEYRSLLVRNLALSQQLATDMTKKAQETMKKNFDKKSADTKFKVGDWVLLEDPTLQHGRN